MSDADLCRLGRRRVVRIGRLRRAVHAKHDGDCQSEFLGIAALGSGSVRRRSEKADVARAAGERR